MEHLYALRDAQAADLDMLFQWANDPAVRKNSFTERTIEYDEHASWYHGLLQDPSRRQYIYTENNRPIG